MNESSIVLHHLQFMHCLILKNACHRHSVVFVDAAPLLQRSSKCQESWWWLDDINKDHLALAHDHTALCRHVEAEGPLFILPILRRAIDGNATHIRKVRATSQYYYTSFPAQYTAFVEATVHPAWRWCGFPQKRWRFAKDDLVEDNISHGTIFCAISCLQRRWWRADAIFSFVSFRSSLEHQICHSIFGNTRHTFELKETNFWLALLSGFWSARGVVASVLFSPLRSPKIGTPSSCVKAPSIVHFLVVVVSKNPGSGCGPLSWKSVWSRLLRGRACFLLSSHAVILRKNDTPSASLAAGPNSCQCLCHFFFSANSQRTFV